MENKNKLVIIALIAVILALLVGILLSMPNLSKADSQLEIIGDDTLVEGSSLQIRLMDINGTALANQTVKVTFTDADSSSSEYSVVTNDEGIGELKLDKNAGDYDVVAVYSGNGGYNGCNATKAITVEKEAVDAQVNTLSNDPGAFYSAQAGRVIYTGEVLNTPGGLSRHLGYNQWEPVK